jgi:hypothetical protein
MISHTIELHLPNAAADSFFAALSRPNAAMHSCWLPEEHFVYKLVKKSPGSPLGDIVYFDEILGAPKFRLKFKATIVVADKPSNIVYQMRKFGVNLPAFLEFRFTDTAGALALEHHLRMGYKGPGSLLDPVIRLFYGKGFFKALAGHCEREWAALPELLAKACFG